MKTVVLGATGMLGSMALDYLRRDLELKVVATARAGDAGPKVEGVEWRVLDAETCTVADIEQILAGAAWAINAIGVIKPYVHDDNAREVERATRVNAVFPHILAQAAERTSCKVLQIATDCVYSGLKGQYTERDPHDALDVYGKTKSLGEVHSPNVFHLRCSIIGPEQKAHVSLLDWFRSQKPGAELRGFTNHRWNGVTTLHYAKLCRGVMAADAKLPHVQHVLAGDDVTKCEMLQLFQKAFGRDDLKIQPVEAAAVVDRTLRSADEATNAALWRMAGYAKPPGVGDMVCELAEYMHA